MPSKRSPEFDKRCIQLYHEGQKTINICRSMGIADRTLYKILSDHGISRKTESGPISKKDKDRAKYLQNRRDYLETRLSIIRPSMNYERARTLAMLEVVNDKLKELRTKKDKILNKVNPSGSDLRVSDASSVVCDIPWSYAEE